MAQTVQHVGIGRSEDFGIGRTGTHFASGIEQRVVALLMEIAHPGRRLHVSANPGARQIAPVAVVAGADVKNDEVTVADNSVRSKTPVGSGVRARADDVRALR